MVQSFTSWRRPSRMRVFSASSSRVVGGVGASSVVFVILRGFGAREEVAS